MTHHHSNLLVSLAIASGVVGSVCGCGGASRRSASDTSDGAGGSGASGTSQATAQCLEPVSFADPVLDGLVHQFTGGADGAPVSPDDLAKVTILSAYQPVASLAGIECLTKLSAFLLNRGGTVSDFSPLSRLTQLDSLALVGEFPSLTDLSPLASLTQLTFVIVSGTSVADISALSGLKNLNSLALADDQIKDVSVLASLTSLSATLQLSGNHIRDIRPLTPLTGVTNLDLTSNLVEDIAPLASSFCLTTPDQGFCSVGLNGNRLDCLSQAPHIAALRARGVQVYTDCP
jgi:hypothetical protein